MILKRKVYAILRVHCVLLPVVLYWDGSIEQPMKKKRDEILKVNKTLADKASVFSQHFATDKMPEQQSPEYLEKDLCFIGPQA